MKLTFLGTGTSQGVPVIGCDCNVCKSVNPKNKRLRPSVFIEVNGLNLLIDAGNEFRTQMLTYKIKNIDGVLLTHHHYDHISGINDLREFNFIQNQPIDIFGNISTLSEVKTTFRYAFNDKIQQGGGLPRLNLINVNGQNFLIRDVQIIPVQVFHGDLKILGYRIQNLAYITDASFIPEESFEKLKNLDFLILNTLKYRPHPTHFNLEESIAISTRIGAKMTYFTHICHDLEHDRVNSELPSGMELAYDGLIIEC